jgi:hypothetical protein
MALFGIADDFLRNRLMKTSRPSVAKLLYLDQSSRRFEIGYVSSVRGWV